MLIQNIGRLVTMVPAADREGALGVIPNAALWVQDGVVAWVGPARQLPDDAHGAESTALDAEGSVVAPGLVDAHTHLVHAGSREAEFVRRARGESYQQIAASGGGILATVAATREAGEDALLTAAKRRAFEALCLGTTTVEIKSGYGLDAATELKLLRVVRALAGQLPQRFVATFLGAHAVPPEFRARRAAYVQLVCEEMLPAVAAEKLATFCDVFVEEGAFTPDEARTICAAATRHGLRPRLHVDQFSDGGGGALAAELGASCADHLDCVSDAGIAAMRTAGVVAGILPAASFFTGKGKYPPIQKLVDAGVPILLATDYNPGTAPTLDLFLCATIAVTQMGLDPDLAWAGITRIAAQSLGLADVGHLEVGARADVLILGCKNEYYPFYRFGSSAVRTVMCNGEVVWDVSP